MLYQKATVEDVLDFIAKERGAFAKSPITTDADLLDLLDWDAMHPDERLAQFLTDFCRHFRITHAHPHWKPYPGQGTGFWRWVDFLGHGGPDEQFFFALEYPTLPVALLIEIVRTGEWIYPVHWVERRMP